MDVMKSLTCFKALADSTRLRLYHILLHHEMSVGEIVSLLEMGQSRISRHLKILTDCGLLRCRRDGVWAFYSAETGTWAEPVASMVTSLGEDEAQVEEDLKRSESVIRDRRLQRLRFFDKIAPSWDRLKADIIGDFDLNEALMEGVTPCKKAVDLGCGTGALMGRMTRSVEKVMGVDSSPNMLQEAEKRLKGLSASFDLRLGELEHLPMGDGEVELAVISLALHHLDRPELAVKESARVVAPGGMLLIAEFERHADESLRERFGDRWLGFSQQELRAWLKASGFTNIVIQRFPITNGPTLLKVRAIKEKGPPAAR